METIMNNSSIKFTIITVVYNDVSHIEDTILSVLNQTYSNIEYIIIDGASKDGTTNIIQKYMSKLSLWISEPDKGIYDAMNKGIKLATGDFINFMNSGDCFYSNNSISEIANHIKNKDCIYFGKTVGKFKYGKLIQKIQPFYEAKKYCPGVGICHQSIFVPTQLAKKSPFDLSYKVCADHHMLYKMYCNGTPFKFINTLVSEITSDEGYSDKNILIKLKERGRIYNLQNTKEFIFFLYFNFLKQKIRQVVKKIEPSKLRKYRFRKKNNSV